MLPAVLSERKRRTKMNARLSTPMNSRIPSQNLAHQAKTKRMVQLALMISIIFVMAFSPLGYLRTPGLTSGRSRLRSGIRYYQPDHSYDRRQSVQLHAAFHQSTRSGIYLPGSPCSGGMALRADLCSSQTAI